jgi:hypothetical protein
MNSGGRLEELELSVNKKLLEILARLNSLFSPSEARLTLAAI